MSREFPIEDLKSIVAAKRFGSEPVRTA